MLHARALLDGDRRGVTDYIEADLREPGSILTAAARTLDFTKPVAVMLIAVMHLIVDEDDPYARETQRHRTRAEVVLPPR